MHASTATMSRQYSAQSVATLTARVVGAAMLALTAVIHLRLYSHYGYRHIPTIGGMFLANIVGGFALTALVLASPRRLLGFGAFAGAGYEALTLAGFVYSLYQPLFNFQDSTQAPLWKSAVTVESVGIVVMSAITLAALNRWRSRTVTGR
jgi:uncharacterized membrane protein